MYLVVGATGNLGGAITRMLLAPGRAGAGLAGGRVGLGVPLVIR